jgi:hypothetical protein
MFVLFFVLFCHSFFVFVCFCFLFFCWSFFFSVFCLSLDMRVWEEAGQCGKEGGWGGHPAKVMSFRKSYPIKMKKEHLGGGSSTHVKGR